MRHLRLKASFDQARFYTERAEALGEPPEDPLLLFSVLYGLWGASFAAFDGAMHRELSAQFLALAERQAMTVPLMIGHRLMGNSLMCTGDIVEGRAHLDRALAFYNPVEHRPLAAQFGQDIGMAILIYRSLAQWMLGYPDAALADTNHALRDARDTGQAATLMFALSIAGLTYIICGNYTAATAQCDELVVLADKKDARFRKAEGVTHRGCVLGLTGKASDAVQMITSGIADRRSAGITIWMPFYLLNLARGHAELDQFDAAWRSINDATTAVENARKSGARRKSTGQQAKSHSGRRSRMPRKRKRISSARSRSRVSSKQSPGNCAPR